MPVRHHDVHADCACQYWRGTAALPSGGDHCPPVRATRFPDQLQGSRWARVATEAWIEGSPADRMANHGGPADGRLATMLWSRSAPTRQRDPEEDFYIGVASTVRSGHLGQTPTGFIDTTTAEVVEAIAELDLEARLAESSERTAELSAWIAAVEANVPGLVAQALGDATDTALAHLPGGAHGLGDGGGPAADRETLAGDVMELLAPRILEEIPKAVAVYVKRSRQ